MKIEKKVAEALGLSLVNKAETAMGREDTGFAGRRIYVNAAPPFAEWSGSTLHLSGFTPEESELLGAVPNQLVENKKTGKREYFASARISGFLQLTEANLRACAELVKHTTDAAWERQGSGETSEAKSAAAGIFAAITATQSE